jgi:hypothetical protein
MEASTSEVREWLVAVGTVGAVIVALALAFYTGWRENRRRPVLALSYDQDSDLVMETVRTVYAQTLGSLSRPAAYLRFGVSNKLGRLAAQDVQILLADIVPLEYGPGVPDLPRPINISYPALTWTHSLDDPTRITLAPGLKRYIDVARVEEGEDSRLELLIHPAPADERHRLPAGTYRLVFAVAPSNADASFFETIIRFDGRWAEDINRHVVVAPPRPSKRRADPSAGSSSGVAGRPSTS